MERAERTGGSLVLGLENGWPEPQVPFHCSSPGARVSPAEPGPL